MEVLSRAGKLALCAAALLITFQAPAQTQTVVLKETLETSSSAIGMPSSADGMMTVTTTCRNCPAMIFRSTAKTIYKLRDMPVSFTTFREALASSDAYVAVQFAKTTHELVSVTANLDAPAARKP
jgi:hypothetical protein